MLNKKNKKLVGEESHGNIPLDHTDYVNKTFEFVKKINNSNIEKIKNK